MHVALIQFKEAGKRYYFDPLNFQLENGIYVVVETVRGIEIGKVVQLKDILETELISELKPILRIATDDDKEADKYNLSLEKEIVKKTKELSFLHNLELKVLGAEYTLDRKKLLIYFEAEGRVDFRDLVKDLSDVYKTRIELRQVGPRDGAKMIGSIGPCGYLLCCNTFIGQFDTVSIKMAKNQNISINTQKISGLCGKLLCCIKYEDDVYTEIKKEMPALKEIILVDGIEAEVLEVGYVKGTIKARILKDGSIVHLHNGEYKRK
ncbi:stage 0 sporulation protein [Acholeplasma sp. OttesenSCG-928-E16]|nr:stage 0 sporulation protein [Acholeplasma sp. OttesenSCG-928-E16]